MKDIIFTQKKKYITLLTFLATLMASSYSNAERRIIHIEIINHLFIPEQIEIQAGEKIKLVINNRDKTPEEFESYELNREKVIMGGRKANIFIGPLRAGIYPFFGEFNQRTAQGKLIVLDIQTNAKITNESNK